jgi:hypothetical protein
MRRLAAVIVIASAAVARAHVVPSLDDNNRYLKLTPLGDRVRLAYTVYLGEVPGAAARRELDRDHDGRISDDEAHAFGDKLAAQVKAGLAVTIDGAAVPVVWNQVDVGLGEPVTAAGSFSVDLIAWLCLPGGGASHTLVLKDTFAVPRPGETELRVEDTPGVHVDVARLGMIDLVDLDARWQGAGGPLAFDGFKLTFTPGAKAPVPKDGACKAGVPATTSRSSTTLYLVVGGAFVLALVGGAIVRARTKRGRAARSEQARQRGGGKGSAAGVTDG